MNDVNNAAYGGAGTITTDATGAYLFDDLAPGTYQVRVTTPDPIWRTTRVLNSGSPSLSDVDSDLGALGVDGRTAVAPQITLAPLDRILKVDGGLVRPGTIGDRLWVDANGNGIADDGETGAAGAAVSLWSRGADNTFGTGDDVAVTADIDGTTFGNAGTITTSGSGAYEFAGLRPDTYQVRVTTAAGTVITTANAGERRHARQ